MRNFFENSGLIFRNREKKDFRIYRIFEILKTDISNKYRPETDSDMSRSRIEPGQCKCAR